MHRFLRFFQPVGCALITLGLLDTISNSFWLLLQYSSLDYKYFRVERANEDYGKNLIWHFLLVLKFLLCFVLWIGVVWMGKNTFLILWTVLTFLGDVGIVTFVILDKLCRPFFNYSTVSIWGFYFNDPYPVYFSLGMYALVRFYLFLVGVQGIICIHRKYDSSRRRASAENISDIEVCLEPIGYGFHEVWAFLRDFPGMGAIILLTTEMVWNMEHFLLREIFAFLLERPGKALLEIQVEKRLSDYVFLEDDVMRGIRIVLAFLGLIYIHKERLNYVRLWVLAYFVSLVCSNVILGLSVAMKDVNWIVFHVLCHICDSVFRIFVLYFTFKFAIVHRRTIGK